MSSPFYAILQRAVEAIPGAVGGAFAASDGEMVDYFARGDAYEWALLTAHFGVILSHARAALLSWHFGETNLLMLEHASLVVLLHTVQDGYYVAMALDQPRPLGQAMRTLARVADELAEEMS